MNLVLVNAVCFWRDPVGLVERLEDGLALVPCEKTDRNRHIRNVFKVDIKFNQLILSSLWLIKGKISNCK